LSTVAFDLSTTPAGSAYYEHGRAPELLAGSVYYVSEERYVDYLPPNVLGLVTSIQEATELISFSGSNLDFAVLRQRYGLTGNVPASGVHVDMLDVLRPHFGASLTLDDATQRFLGERSYSMDEFRKKHGLVHDPVNRTDAIAKCREDIRQTLALWRMWKSGGLEQR
jgi:hypothetical protein